MKHYEAEPVPLASQLMVLPFVAAVEGLVRLRSTGAFVHRVTMHRLLSRQGKGYLQQLCNYQGTLTEQTGVGRIFRVDETLIGAAFVTGKIFRTKRYAGETELAEALTQDMAKTHDTRRVDEVAKSYLAIPFTSTAGVALVLFADSRAFNLFASDDTISDILGLCNGFARLLDSLETRAVPTIRNFPPQAHMEFEHGGVPAYPTIQEALDVAPPHLERLTGFHYDVAQR